MNAKELTAAVAALTARCDALNARLDAAALVVKSMQVKQQPAARTQSSGAQVSPWHRALAQVRAERGLVDNAFVPRDVVMAQMKANRMQPERLEV